MAFERFSIPPRKGGGSTSAFGLGGFGFGGGKKQNPVAKDLSNLLPPGAGPQTPASPGLLGSGNVSNPINRLPSNPLPPLSDPTSAIPVSSAPKRRPLDIKGLQQQLKAQEAAGAGQGGMGWNITNLWAALDGKKPQAGGMVAAGGGGNATPNWQNILNKLDPSHPLYQYISNYMKNGSLPNGTPQVSNPLPAMTSPTAPFPQNPYDVPRPTLPANNPWLASLPQQDWMTNPAGGGGGPPPMAMGPNGPYQPY